MVIHDSERGIHRISYNAGVVKYFFPLFFHTAPSTQR
jgi:hypothetical protein